MMNARWILMVPLLLACTSSPASLDAARTDLWHEDIQDEADHASPDVPWDGNVAILVLLDGVPTGGISVSQGGKSERYTTAEDGTVVVPMDLTVPGDLAIVASHPEARIEAAMVWPGLTESVIELDRFSTVDNEAYLFQNPGEPGHSPTSAQCGHCHKTIADDFFASRHPYSASNPVLQDIYAGTGAAFATEEECLARGGSWLETVTPGSLEKAPRCFVGAGVLSTLNECLPGQCDDKASNFGGCADCHAPGIDGALGGRDLLEATGFGYQRGIHCDVCHHVESVKDDGLPGIAGRLRVLRPSDPAVTPSFGDWRPLLFGPHDDIPNPFMGIVQRGFFRESRFCAGCHELERGVLVPGATADSSRWPGGKLPLLSTFSEWLASGSSASCQGCHMPGDMDVENTADLQLFPTTVGVAGGWPREKPAVRRHIWLGPRTEGRPLSGMVATLDLQTERVGDELIVSATTAHGGAAHAVPTGEPLRSLLLVISAQCEGQSLPAQGGDVISDIGGYRQVKGADEDWAHWPGATIGQWVHVVTRTGKFYDYPGVGAFGDGTFDAPAKGMPVEHAVGMSVIVDMAGDIPTFQPPLPAGDIAYLVDAPTTDGLPTGLAGAPGFAFARVLVGADGTRMVPHYLATDVASDNRLMPETSWTTTHRFQATCDNPSVLAKLIYRPLPLAQARARGWAAQDTVLVEATK